MLRRIIFKQMICIFQFRGLTAMLNGKEEVNTNLIQ